MADYKREEVLLASFAAKVFAMQLLYLDSGAVSSLYHKLYPCMKYDATVSGRGENASDSRPSSDNFRHVGKTGRGRIRFGTGTTYLCWASKWSITADMQ